MAAPLYPSGLPEPVANVSARGFPNTGLQNPNVTTTSGAPPVPTPATNPYDVTKLLGPAPDFSALTKPPPQVGQFQENTGAASGAGMGHFATADDLKAHHDAAIAAKNYLELSKHLHELHNTTQKDLDTAGAFHALTGFDITHPQAEQNLAKIRAQFPYADPESFHGTHAAMTQHQALFGKMALQEQKSAARDTFKNDLHKDFGITPDELIMSPAQAGTIPGSPKHEAALAAAKITDPKLKEKFHPMDEKEGGDTIKIYNRQGKPVFMPVGEYYARKSAAIAHASGATPEPITKTRATDADVAKRIGVTQPAGPGLTTEPDHASAVEWAQKNPKDSRAAEILSVNKPK